MFLYQLRWLFNDFGFAKSAAESFWPLLIFFLLSALFFAFLSLTSAHFSLLPPHHSPYARPSSTHTTLAVLLLKKKQTLCCFFSWKKNFFTSLRFFYIHTYNFFFEYRPSLKNAAFHLFSVCSVSFSNYSAVNTCESASLAFLWISCVLRLNF